MRGVLVTTVAVTGVGGVLGRRLVERLDEHADVDRIVGLDLRAPAGLSSPKLAFRVADVREPGLEDVLHGVDVVIHLAFEFDPSRDEAEMHAVNVEGTRRILRGAVAAGARKVIYVSSGMVYGAHPDNDLPLTEDSPLRANLQFGYAEHKLEVEEWLWPWAAEQTGTVVTALRPSILAGAGIDNFITRQLEAPRFPVVKGHKPPMQFVHVDDVVSALVHAFDHDLPGAYNVSSEGWLSFDEVTALLDRPVLELPEEVAFSTAERLWELGVGFAPPGQLHYLMHPWVLTVDRLRETGWRPTHSNRDALAALLADHEDWLSLPGVRVRRSMLRGGIAIAGLALAAALIALRARRHQRPADE
jgi:nucleoside-diphosphate-sugar epimerase